MLMAIYPVDDIMYTLKRYHHKYTNNHHHIFKKWQNYHNRLDMSACKDYAMTELLFHVERSHKFPDKQAYLKQNHILTNQQLHQQLKHHPRAKKWQIIRQKLAQEEDKNNHSVVDHKYFQRQRGHIEPISYQTIMKLGKNIQKTLHSQAQQSTIKSTKNNPRRSKNKPKRASHTTKKHVSSKTYKNNHKAKKTAKHKKIIRSKVKVQNKAHQQHPKIKLAHHERVTKPRKHITSLYDLNAFHQPTKPAHPHQLTAKQKLLKIHVRHQIDKEKLAEYHARARRYHLKRHSLGINNSNDLVARPHQLRHHLSFSQRMQQAGRRLNPRPVQPKPQPKPNKKHQQEIEAFQRSIGVRR